MTCVSLMCVFLKLFKNSLKYSSCILASIFQFHKLTRLAEAEAGVNQHRHAVVVN